MDYNIDQWIDSVHKNLFLIFPQTYLINNSRFSKVHFTNYTVIQILRDQVTIFIIQFSITQTHIFSLKYVTKKV